MNLGWLLFLFKGRINRAKWWLGIVIMFVFGIVASVIIPLAGLNPMTSQLVIGQQKCQGITEKDAKLNCIVQNTPMIAEFAAEQEKCKQLTDNQQIQECNKQVGNLIMQKYKTVFNKMFINMVPLYLLQLWVGIALCVKRFHDLNKSGWFYLLYLIPLVNIGILIWQGFYKGTAGTNRFGADPLQGNVVV